jgi:hypothetical protein
MLDIGSRAPQLHTLFTQTARTVARATGFVKRTSKLTGAAFLHVLTFDFLDDPEASLNDLVETSRDLGVPMTQQGLQTRSADAVPFLNAMFQQGLSLFRSTARLDLTALQQFTAIYLTESSTIAVPASLQAEFPGCGGNGPAALGLSGQLDRSTQVGCVLVRGTHSSSCPTSKRSA